jgi:hypothetical protein
MGPNGCFSCVGHEIWRFPYAGLWVNRYYEFKLKASVRLERTKEMVGALPGKENRDKPQRAVSDMMRITYAVKAEVMGQDILAAKDDWTYMLPKT